MHPLDNEAPEAGGQRRCAAAGWTLRTDRIFYQPAGPHCGDPAVRLGAVHAGVPAHAGQGQQHVPRGKGWRPAHLLPPAKNLRKKTTLWSTPRAASSGWAASLGARATLWLWTTAAPFVVNGAVQSGEILYPTYAKDALEYPYTMPEGCFFVLGDYRTQSEDSRDFGPVPLEDVQAKSNYTTAATQSVIPRRPEEAAGILPVNRGVWAAAQEYELFLTREE